MSGIYGQQVSLGQANGPEVDLIVDGTELYAHYETPAGHPVVYDDGLGLFCYARVIQGAFQSSGIPLRDPPPPGIEIHSRESDEIRKKKIAERVFHMEQRRRGVPETNRPL